MTNITALESKGWARVADRDAITKTFVFRDFKKAFAWMTQIAIWAEVLNHHPEWENIYNTVTVVLTTHDVGGLSDLDVALAEKMEQTMDDE
ncbi:MAG: 4a-hydroxytetrahydrobiopterin dehydratase [Pseudomonadota bacterium]